MRTLRWSALAALALALLMSLTHTTPVAAQDLGCGSCGAVPGDPSGPDPSFDAQCVTAGGTSVAYDDENGDFYGWACFALPTDGNCPDGTVLAEPSAPGPEQEVCAWESESGGHQPWRDGPRGHCTLDTIEACQQWQQAGATGGDKGIYPVIGSAYVANTNGEGVICRVAPGGDKVTSLPEGAEVTELADGVDDGWQLVAYATGSPACYISAAYLSDTAPTSGQQSGDTNSDNSTTASADEAANTNDGTSVGGGTTIATGDVQVTTLPVTGYLTPPPSNIGWWIGLLAKAAVIVALLGMLVFCLGYRGDAKADARGLSQQEL